MTMLAELEAPPTFTRVTDSLDCARCDGRMVITRDALGRERRRCPRCDGVSRVRVHPDEVLLPQGLVRAQALPSVLPGQLRCQRCARGVDPSERFCVTCKPGRGHSISARVYQPKPCVRCGEMFQPSGPRALYCTVCTSPARPS